MDWLKSLIELIIEPIELQYLLIECLIEPIELQYIMRKQESPTATQIWLGNFSKKL